MYVRTTEVVDPENYFLLPRVSNKHTRSFLN